MTNRFEQAGVKYEVSCGGTVVGYLKYMDDVLAMSKAYSMPLDVQTLNGKWSGQVLCGEHYTSEQQ